MATLTGVLLDVSDSMKKKFDGEKDKEVVELASMVFEVIDNFVKYDVSPENFFFAVGAGGRYGSGVFDIIKTIETFQNVHPINTTNNLQLTHDEVVENFQHLMVENGAKNIRKWADKEVIKAAVNFEMADFLLRVLQSNGDFLKTFVDDCLPTKCQDIRGQHRFVGTMQVCQNIGSSFITNFKQANEADIRLVVENAKRLLLKDVGSVFSFRRVSTILHGCIESDKLDHNRIKELIKTIQPFIYGTKALYKALDETTKVFSTDKYSKHKKLLFIFSDGEPTTSELFSVSEKLKNLGVTIVSCLINKCSNIQPKQLCSVESQEWNEGGKCLFRLSSTIPSQLLPRTIFIKRGWNIDIINNETKLFLQISHPDNIKDVCDLARNVICCQDSLSEVLMSVSLDIYINQNTTKFTVQRQFEGTCYANACAAVLYLSMNRILGRRGGYPSFSILRNKLIEIHGINGASVCDVLKDINKDYRLHFKIVNIKDAMNAIVAKRPCVATFLLTKTDWDKFGAFFQTNPTGILTIAEIDIRKPMPDQQVTGHAVVFTSFNSKCLHFMNSWGDNWADKGFFRVENYEVLNFIFYDIFWTLEDLYDDEKNHFNKSGAEVAKNFMTKLQSLQKAKYECPECSKTSLVTAFSGTLIEAVCPLCKKSFRGNTDGNILALNMYLSSLAI